MSGACPECTRALQRWLVSCSDKLIASGSISHAWAVVSMVDSRWSYELRHLQGVDIAVIRRQMDRIFAVAGISHAVGGIDISVNED
jgi:hypothetical protein